MSGKSVAEWSLSGGNVARITVALLRIPTSTSEGGSSGFTPGTGTARCRHERISFVDESLDMTHAI